MILKIPNEKLARLICSAHKMNSCRMGKDSEIDCSDMDDMTLAFLYCNMEQEDLVMTIDN